MSIQIEWTGAFVRRAQKKINTQNQVYHLSINSHCSACKGRRLPRLHIRPAREVGASNETSGEVPASTDYGATGRN